MRIYADGVWDIFHVGHINVFKRLKYLNQRENYVLIGVCSDEFCKAYKREIIICMEHRVEMIQSCKYVDEVIPACPAPVTEEFMHQYDIDLVVHGDDYDSDEIEKWYHVPILMKKFSIVPYTSGISTSSIIERCRNITG